MRSEVGPANYDVVLVVYSRNGILDNRERGGNRQTLSVLVAAIGKLELENNAKWSREDDGRQTIAVADITSFE